MSRVVEPVGDDPRGVRRPVEEPLAQTFPEFFLRGVGEAPPEVGLHDLDAQVLQFQCHTQFFAVFHNASVRGEPGRRVWSGGRERRARAGRIERLVAGPGLSAKEAQGGFGSHVDFAAGRVES